MKKVLETAIEKVKGSGNNLKRFILTKKTGDTQLIVGLVLLGVGVSLCLIFRNSISTFLTGFCTALWQKVTDSLNFTA